MNAGAFLSKKVPGATPRGFQPLGNRLTVFSRKEFNNIPSIFVKMARRVIEEGLDASLLELCPGVQRDFKLDDPYEDMEDFVMSIGSQVGGPYCSGVRAFTSTCPKLNCLRKNTAAQKYSLSLEKPLAKGYYVFEMGRPGVG